MLFLKAVIFRKGVENMSRGKNINMFLMEGDVTSSIKCTLSNWTGVIYKIPRTKLNSELIKQRQHLKYSGIYFLIGKSDKEDKNLVYVGQAGNRKNGKALLLRLLEHTKDGKMDFFNEVIVLTTDTNIFGPTELNYLENKFAERYILKNQNEPNIGNVTEEKESELIEILSNSEMIIGTLGHKLFIPTLNKDTLEEEVAKDKDLLFLSRKIRKSNLQIEAKCKRTNEGFVGLKGSMISLEDLKTMPKLIKKLRDQLITSKIIKNGILMENQLFISASYAAAFVLGTNANGLTHWKTKNGQTLKELEEN